MSFLGDYEKSAQAKKASGEALEAARGEALKHFDTLLGEMEECFGADPKELGLQVVRPTFPIQDMSGPYHATGLKVTFPNRQYIQVKPEGMAFGGYAVSIDFVRCIHNQSHRLLFAKVESINERRWFFFSKGPDGRPHFKSWSKAEFEEILSYQVLGKTQPTNQ